MSNTLISDPAAGQAAVWPAIRHGLRRRCPACGEGALFTSYLKVAPVCDHCGQELHHQRADDGPAYLTVLIVCHVVGFLLHPLAQYTSLSSGMIAVILCGLAIPLCLVMLPSMKGLMIGVQWAKRMHGFGQGPVGQSSTA